MYHEARDWICLQDQSILTLWKISSPCRTLETWCEQFPKTKGHERGHVKLTTITAATATTSSIHQDTLNTQFKCTKCGHYHLPSSCPAYGKKLYNFGNKGYFMSLCRRSESQHSKEQNNFQNNRSYTRSSSRVMLTTIHWQQKKKP